MPPALPPGGSSLSGFWIPILYEDPGAPPGILADPIDPATGEYLSIERSFDPTDAAVLTAITTERRSGASVMTVGQRFRDLQLVTNSTPQDVRAEASLALKRLTDSGQIQIEQLLPVAEDDWAEVTIRYRNVPRAKTQAPQLALGRLA
jgi:hypothetical protein